MRMKASVNPRGQLYLRKEIQKLIGIRKDETVDKDVELIVDKKTFLVVPKNTSPSEVLKSIEIIRKQVEHEIEES